MSIFKKKGIFCQSRLRSLSSILLRGQIWYEIAKTPLFRGVLFVCFCFCFVFVFVLHEKKKTCLGVSFRSDIHACVHLNI